MSCLIGSDYAFAGILDIVFGVIAGRADATMLSLAALAGLQKYSI
jgi:hypothetical protein